MSIPQIAQPTPPRQQDADDLGRAPFAVKLLATLAVFISCAVALYAIGCWIYMQYDPGAWPMSGRVLLVICTFVGTALLMGLIGINPEGIPDGDG